MTKKLYRVTCRGMHGGMSSECHGIAYVIAENTEQAYQTLRTSLDTKNLGFEKERALEKVELVAESAECPGCGFVLYFA